VQVDPMKPKFKPPGTKRLNLNCEILLSTSAFKLNERRYIEGAVFGAVHCDGHHYVAAMRNDVKVRRCRLTLSNPH
jgi:hypothetical protein